MEHIVILLIVRQVGLHVHLKVNFTYEPMNFTYEPMNFTYEPMNFTYELFTPVSSIVIVDAVGHLVLSHLTLYLVAFGAQTAVYRFVNGMHIVDMYVQSLLSCEKFAANVAEVVVNLPWQTGLLACTSPCGR